MGWWGCSVMVFGGVAGHCRRAMKHHKHTKPNRQTGKPASKTTTRATPKTAGKAKGQAAAKKSACKAVPKPAKKVAKKATWMPGPKPAAKVGGKQAAKPAPKIAGKQPPDPAPAASAPPGVLDARFTGSKPFDPLRPHVGPRYTDPLDYPA